MELGETKLVRPKGNIGAFLEAQRLLEFVVEHHIIGPFEAIPLRVCVKMLRVQLFQLALASTAHAGAQAFSP